MAHKINFSHESKHEIGKSIRFLDTWKGIFERLVHCTKRRLLWVEQNYNIKTYWPSWVKLKWSHRRISHRVTPEGIRQSSAHNLLSCMEHPEVVQVYIEKECSLGRLLGPFPRAQAKMLSLHISTFGIILKKGTNNWRLIVDLWAPYGASINDGIAQEGSSSAYVTIDMSADRVRAMGQGTLLVKLNIKSMFSILPAHLSDRCLLGMQWNDPQFADAVLPIRPEVCTKTIHFNSRCLQFIAWSQGIENGPAASMARQEGDFQKRSSITSWKDAARCKGGEARQVLHMAHLRANINQQRAQPAIETK